MRLPQRGPDRPPRGVAGSSTLPVVTCLLASANPEDSRWRSDGVARGAGRWWSLPDRDGLTISGWFVDLRLLPGDEWQSYALACVGAHLSVFPLGWRLPYMHSKLFLYRSVDHRDGG